MMDENDMMDQTKSDGLKKTGEKEEPQEIEMTCVICQKEKTKVYWDVIEGVVTICAIGGFPPDNLRIPMCHKCWDRFTEISTLKLRKRLVGLCRTLLKEAAESES